MKRWVRVPVLLCVALLSCSAQAQPVKKTVWPEVAFGGIPMVCDYPTHFAMDTNGVLTISKLGHMWTKNPDYNLSKGAVVVEANVNLDMTPFQAAEYVVAFSDSVSSDAAKMLFFRIGCAKDDWAATYVSRGGGMPDMRIKESDYLLLPDKWHNVVVKLSSNSLVACVDGKEVINADLSGHPFPSWGHIGLLGWRDAPCRVRDFRIQQQ